MVYAVLFVGGPWGAGPAIGLRADPDAPPRVLVLTTFDLDDVVYEALRAGASGFLLKDVSEDRLVTAIRVIAEGGALFAPSATAG